MIKMLVFIALVIAIGSVLYLIGNKVSKVLKIDVSENLENDIQKGKQAKQKIKQLSKKIK
jgi:hypothetical protein